MSKARRICIFPDLHISTLPHSTFLILHFLILHFHILHFYSSTFLHFHTSTFPHFHISPFPHFSISTFPISTFPHFHTSTFPENQVKMHASMLNDKSHIFTFQDYSKVINFMFCTFHCDDVFCALTPQVKTVKHQKKSKKAYFQ